MVAGTGRRGEREGLLTRSRPPSGWSPSPPPPPLRHTSSPRDRLGKSARRGRRAPPLQPPQLGAVAPSETSHPAAAAAASGRGPARALLALSGFPGSTLSARRRWSLPAPPTAQPPPRKGGRSGSRGNLRRSSRRRSLLIPLPQGRRWLPSASLRRERQQQQQQQTPTGAAAGRRREPRSGRFRPSSLSGRKLFFFRGPPPVAPIKSCFLQDRLPRMARGFRSLAFLPFFCSSSAFSFCR